MTKMEPTKQRESGEKREKIQLWTEIEPHRRKTKWSEQCNPKPSIESCFCTAAKEEIITE